VRAEDEGLTAGMMGQFVVIEPGQESQVSIGPAYDRA